MFGGTNLVERFAGLLRLLAMMAVCPATVMLAQIPDNDPKMLPAPKGARLLPSQSAR